MDRFSAYLLIRRGLKRRSSRTQALATEAIMEELAAHAGQPPEHWGVMGLLCQLDHEYAEHNPRVRGKAARQQAELEGLDPAQAQSLERWCQPAPADDRSQLEHALVLADALAAAALERGEGYAPELAAILGHDLDLRRQRGDAAGELMDGALHALGLEAREAARLALAGLRRIEGDLR